MVVEPSERRCPCDFQGVDRTATPHDGWEFKPDRWLETGDTSSDERYLQKGLTMK